jgi:hypothetical protein
MIGFKILVDLVASAPSLIYVAELPSDSAADAERRATETGGLQSMDQIASQDVREIELSLIVPTFNERENIIPLLERIESALYGISWELIVVDDNSPDGTSNQVLESCAGPTG